MENVISISKNFEIWDSSGNSGYIDKFERIKNISENIGKGVVLVLNQLWLMISYDHYHDRKHIIIVFFATHLKACAHKHKGDSWRSGGLYM